MNANLTVSVCLAVAGLFCTAPAWAEIPEPCGTPPCADGLGGCTSATGGEASPDVVAVGVGTLGGGCVDPII